MRAKRCIFIATRASPLRNNVPSSMRIVVATRPRYVRLRKAKLRVNRLTGLCLDQALINLSRSNCGLCSPRLVEINKDALIEAAFVEQLVHTVGIYISNCVSLNARRKYLRSNSTNCVQLRPRVCKVSATAASFLLFSSRIFRVIDVMIGTHRFSADMENTSSSCSPIK